MSSMLTLAGNAAPTGFYDFPIEQSLRFNDNDSAYLSWTPESAGNRKTWTWSGWVKRGNLGLNSLAMRLFGCQIDGSNRTDILFSSSDAIEFQHRDSGANTGNLVTQAVYRDTSSWYHIVFALDTTNTTSSNRMRLYVNGIQVTDITTTEPSLNLDMDINSANIHMLCRYNPSASQHFDGYLAEVNFIDGQALDPTSFGELKSGIWIPKDTAGLTFGTNGFRLQFGDTTEASGFNAVTWTGNGTSQSISGTGFSSSPDLVWTKKRSSTSSHYLVDSVRGSDKVLFGDTTDAEVTTSNVIASLDSDGFSIGADGGINASGQTFVGWAWDAGSGSAASNTDGSITSTVKANTDYGFSIVSYAGNSTAGATIGHGLGVAPDMIIAKRRNTTGSWGVYHSGMTSATYQMWLNLTNGETSRPAQWNSTAPTSSVFSIGTDTDVNASGSDYIAYCFAEKTGYSKFGSYTGTGATGNSITTGFKPAFVMTKKTSGASNWNIIDNTRNTSNPVDNFLIANGSNTEFSGYDVDFTSTGFILNNSEGGFNASGETYIYMAFADTRDAAFWRDTSGQNNDWQPNNLVFSDVVPDAPSNNFAVLAPVNNPTDVYAEGRLKFQGLTSATSPYSTSVLGTFGVSSGKWYYEARANTRSNGVTIGFAREGLMPADGSIPSYKVFAFNIFDNIVTTNNSNTNDFTVTGAAGDILGLAIDIDNGTASAYINGTLKGSVTGLNTSGYQNLPYATLGWASGGQTMTMNFGQDSTFAGLEAAGGNADENGYGDFAYAPPSGYLSLCSANLPSGAINTLADETPEDYFNTVLFSATAGVADSVTGYGFAPDWIWTKARNATQSHQLFDNVRGDGVRLITNSTGAELAAGASYLSLEDDGFDYGTSTFSSNNFVGWGWKANGSGVSNTDGSITSTVSVGATSQQNWFSVVSYTGTGSAGATVGHGLDGTVPDMIIVKSRTEAVGWYVYHSSVASDPETRFLRLDTTAAVATADGAWNNTAPSSSVITLGDGGSTNRSTEDYIAYCFANAEGLCKVGSYTGNGSTDGTFVFTGHRPALLITKHVSSGNWAIWDNRRDPENVVDNLLYPNLSNAQNTGTDRFDFLSNGFKCKNTNDVNAWNASGVDYLFLSIAEQPFKYANAR